MTLTVVVKFSPEPPGISQRFVGQVPFGGAFTRTSLLDRSNSRRGLNLTTTVSQRLRMHKNTFRNKHHLLINKSFTVVVKFSLPPPGI